MSRYGFDQNEVFGYFRILTWTWTILGTDNNEYKHGFTKHNLRHNTHGVTIDRTLWIASVDHFQWMTSHGMWGIPNSMARLVGTQPVCLLHRDVRESPYHASSGVVFLADVIPCWAPFFNRSWCRNKPLKIMVGCLGSLCSVLQMRNNIFNQLFHPKTLQ